jgi:thiol:disulfide interchange protein DsbD
MKKSLLTLFALFLAVGVWAQQLDPVKWSYSVKETSATEAELVFTAKLDAGWHLYSQHTSPDGPIGISFEFTPSGDYTLVGKVAEPKPHEEMDEMFGVVVKSFSGTVVFRQKVKRLSAKDFNVKGTFNYQLCDNGSCIAPEDRDFTFTVPGAKVAKAEPSEPQAVAEQPETAVVEAAPDTTPTDAVTGATTVAEAATASAAKAPAAAKTEPAGEKSQSLLVIFLLAIGGGILTMFTPCVFPMIPMTVNFFMHGSDNKRKNRRQAWFFGFSIVFLFAVLGAILALIFGPEALYNMGTSWIINLVFFVIFFIFALSFFGLFEIKMPEKWVNASDEQADKGGFLAPFFIALTTVLVSFSCTGPILGAALVGLTHTESMEAANRWVSLVTMLGFGIGFAAPFTLLAMFPQFLKNMKSGSWLNTVKVVFAFLELAFGLKFLQMADQAANWGLLPRDIYLALWIVIFGLMGFYLLGKLRFKGDDEVKEIGTLRLFLAIADLAFVVWMIPGLWGAPLKGLSGFVPGMDTQDFNIEKLIVENRGSSGSVSESRLPADRKYADVLELPVGFEGFFDLDEAKAYARQQGKPVFIDFTGKTCANCREMEHYVWSDPEVKRLLNEEFIICSLYADANFIDLPESEWVTDDKGHILKTLGRKNLNYQKTAFNMNAQPYYVIVNADGTVLTKENYKYDRDVQKFINWLNEGINNNK